jgi:hypothetical protein
MVDGILLKKVVKKQPKKPVDRSLILDAFNRKGGRKTPNVPAGHWPVEFGVVSRSGKV